VIGPVDTARWTTDSPLVPGLLLSLVAGRRGWTETVRPMMTTDVLLLLLSVAFAMIVALIAAGIGKADGKSLATAVMIGGGAFATTLIVIYTIVDIYR
jgi:hypothetical protein